MKKLFTLAAVLGLLASVSWAAKNTSSTRELYMQNQIRKELVTLPQYSVFDYLAYKIDGDSVTLLGAVTRPTLKSSAENVVKKIEGVESVHNKIEVLPLSPADDQIRMAVYQAIYGSTALNRYALRAVPPIHIIVKNGDVRLVGVVANKGDKQIAGVQARSVGGTFQVTNDLQVESDLKSE